MGLTIELGGDPESIRAVASWLRNDVAGRLDVSIDEIRRICDQSGRAWCDTAGLSFMSRLDDGGRATYRLLTQVERLASFSRSVLTTCSGPRTWYVKPAGRSRHTGSWFGTAGCFAPASAIPRTTRHTRPLRFHTMLQSHRSDKALAWPAVWQSLVRMHCWVILALSAMTAVFALVASTADDVGSAVLAALGVFIFAFGAAFTFAMSIRARRRTRSQIVLRESPVGLASS